MKNLKSEKGAITLFVLLACLFFVISLLGVYNYVQNRNQSSNSDYVRVKENYEKDIGNENQIYKDNSSEIVDPIDPTDPPAEGDIGGFVRYGVTYIDMYMGYRYTETNGWRILKSSQNSENPDLLDIQLISTGIPANLAYYNTTVKHFEYDGTTIGNWSGNSAQREAYASDFYSSVISHDNYNMYAAAGLYNNFEKLKFKVNSEDIDSSYRNYGYYKEINGKTTEEFDGSIFRDSSLNSKITGIREVTFADLTGKTDSTTSFTDKAGLYILSNLSKITDASAFGVNTYKYTEGAYWVASPYPRDTNGLYYICYDGSIDYNGWGIPNGIRPVISLSGVRLTKNENGLMQIV